MSLNIFLRNQVRYLIAAGIVAVGAVVSMLMPMVASADALSTRSIQLSSATSDATGVTYNVTFTPTTTAGAVVLDFCSNSPIIGDACTDPTSDGLDVTSAASTTTDFTDVTGTGHQIIIAGTMTGGSAVGGVGGIEITGITNPSAGPLYVRMASYNTKTDAETDYSSTTPTGYIDQGAVALTIYDGVHVGGDVRETMTFCVSNPAVSDGTNPIEATCAGGILPPTVKLGEGSPKALAASAVSTGSIFTQISTNASGGAVIRLKSNAEDCGGLLRAGAPAACDIKPAKTADAFDDATGNGKALFGVKTATATGTSGTLEPVSASGYNSSTYLMNYTTGNTAGITSTYGDDLLDTNNAPVDNQNMELTFGASISNNTPAGRYSADLSLIATGKF